jgi:Tol biopolymer transport system component
MGAVKTLTRRAGMIIKSTALLALSLLITLGAVMATITRPAPILHDSKFVQLTHDAATDLDPVFSPDGKRIAFSANRSGSFDIWVMDADGTRRMQLTSMDSDERNPKWSPDGKRIAFVTIAHGKTDIWISSLNGDRIILTDDGASKNSFEWNPSGDLLVYDSNEGGRWNVWLADLQAHRVAQLTESQGDSMYPSWTADGRDILFSSNSNGLFRLYTMSSDGARLRQLTSDTGNDIKPHMSTDGRYIAFVSDRLGRETLWIMDADGTNMREARSMPPSQRPGLGWEPDVALGSYPLWNPKSQGVMYVGNGGEPFYRDENLDIVPAAGGDSHMYVFYENISVVGYYTPFGDLDPSSPWYVVDYDGPGNSLVAMGSFRADEICASWRPDGEAIVYASDHDGAFDIWVQLLGAATPSPYG